MKRVKRILAAILAVILLAMPNLCVSALDSIGGIYYNNKTGFCTWNAFPGADHYDITYSNYAYTFRTNEPSFDVTELVNIEKKTDIIYTFGITAYNSRNEALSQTTSASVRVTGRITTVVINDVIYPNEGMPVLSGCTSASVLYNVSTVSWLDEEENPVTAFKDGEIYTAKITVTAAYDFEFYTTLAADAATVNGEKAQAVFSADAKSAVITKTFVSGAVLNTVNSVELSFAPVSVMTADDILSNLTCDAPCCEVDSEASSRIFDCLSEEELSKTYPSGNFTVFASLKAAAGYRFGDECTLTVNGASEATLFAGEKSADISFEFSAPSCSFKAKFIYSDGRSSELEFTDYVTVPAYETGTVNGYSQSGWLMNGAEYKQGDRLYYDGTYFTFTAVRTPCRVTAYFNAGEGTASFDSKAVTYDEAYGELPTASRTGYTFNGWYLAGGRVNSETVMKSESNHTLTAEWKANNYTVTLVDGENTQALSAAYDSAVALPLPEKDGFLFKGWFLDGKRYDSGFIMKSEGNITLTAQWADSSAVSFALRKPSQTSVKYGDSIYVSVETMPKNCKVEWKLSNDNFKIESKDDTFLKITPVKSGETTVSATLRYNGRDVTLKTVTLTAKAGFFDKLFSFFRKIFGGFKDIDKGFTTSFTEIGL